MTASTIYSSAVRYWYELKRNNLGDSNQVMSSCPGVGSTNPTEKDYVSGAIRILSDAEKRMELIAR